MVAPQRSSFDSSDSSPASSVSRRKRAASRRNAQKSTGPRTAAGKARSAKNSTSHGIFCRDLLLAGESEAMFRNVRESVIRRLRPQDCLELMLVDRVVSSQWRLNRCQRSERLAHETESFAAARKARRRLDRTLKEWGCESREAVNAELAADPNAIEDPELLALWRQLDAAVAHEAEYADPGFTLLQGLVAGRSFANLALYEQRLERSIQRAMSELRRLRDKSTKHWDNLPPSPYAGTAVVTEVELEVEEEDLAEELLKVAEELEELEEELEEQPQDSEPDPASPGRRDASIVE